ncbi:hypothetical protein GOP47_0017520 [Adiantum capillus-veneris]|uniref:BHLH domain-containing protein n=1 Tax=Adiantum capillus-veneris TaxID=13818 RepID=A0A9D4UFY8_ADICA|nr:hypothetical protein GOP47_0017520 [Adiantum capillus-veneris]
MASLSHAPFATPNTPQAASPKLLSSHLSMDPPSASASSSPLSSTLSHPQQFSSTASAALDQHHLNWAPLPLNPTKPFSPLIIPMSPFNSTHPPATFGYTSPGFYDHAYPADQTADSNYIDHGFTGGDEPLLTSSWEALDKLVSASMITGSSSATVNDPLSNFTSLHDIAPAYPSSSAAPAQIASPCSLSDPDQKPLSALYGNLHHQKGNAWSGNNNTNATSATNVGLNLASFISADPGFVDRAAKFSSYSQQVNGPQAYTSSPLQNNKLNSYINGSIRKADYNVDGATCGARKLISSDIRGTNHLAQSASCNVSSLQQQYDAKYNVHASINESNINSTDKHSSPPQAVPMVNLSGCKKKREVLIKDGTELEDDSRGNLGRKRAKDEEQQEYPDSSNGNNHYNKMSSKDNKSKPASNDLKTKQCTGVSNSGESEQKSEVCNNNNNSKTPSSSPSPPPKPDFIHVRARRGQATDSHSLAERVRREKISERMKYLQDLVPGCTKVTGKAMMLDEIINYVQSLQRQVEFLSMKLAAVHPIKLEFNFESLFGKEVVQQPTLHNNCGASALTPQLLETPTAVPLPLNSSSFLQADPMQSLQHSTAFMESMNPSTLALHSLGLDPPTLRGTLSMLAAASSDNFAECMSQISDAWVDDDLQNIVSSLPAGFSQSPLRMHPSVQGTLLNSQMKTEL